MLPKWETERALDALPDWTRGDPDVNVIHYKDMLVMCHPDRQPMIWRGWDAEEWESIRLWDGLNGVPVDVDGSVIR
jgi:hypothetical protein